MCIRFSVLSRTTARLAGAVCLASLVAGCSSGVSRFSEDIFTGSVPAPVGASQALAVSGTAPEQTYPAAPSVDRTHTGSTTPATVGLAPSYRQSPASEPQASQVQRNQLRSAPSIQPDPGVALASVPGQPASASSANAQADAPAQATAAPIRTARTAPNGRADGWTSTGGTQVTIAPGETIFNLSRRYGVPAREILKANGISDPDKIKTGQVLVIPTYVYSRKTPVSAPDNDPKTRFARSSTGFEGQVDPNNVPVPSSKPERQVAVLPTQTANRQNSTTPQPVRDSSTSTVAQAKPPQPTAGAGSVYTVQSGDSLNRIAARSGVSVDAIKQANGLGSSMIRVGQKLTIPGPGGAVDTVRTASVPKQPASTVTAAPESGSGASVADQAKVEAPAPKATGIEKLRWPAKGQIMSGFGDNDNGSPNDGIDISLPAGTPIKAAENGVVIYSGSGLKEYGNTVLVRHDNGLVTVYGHASELIVKRGDNVNRGQVVAVSGMSGEASRPKLHFEIRKNAKPVDPLSYLE